MSHFLIKCQRLLLISRNLLSNNFKGKIPVELGQMINLDTLDLSSNEFYGTISASIGDLEHLLTLNLTRNQLNGPLSAELGNLRSIQIIDLSFNELSGKIPEELGHLQNINSLILRTNNIHGPITMMKNSGICKISTLCKSTSLLPHRVVEASTNQVAEKQMSVYHLPWKIICRDEADTDEVFAQMNLLAKSNV
ncbi:hypothetical protein GIB67_010240 [Kingdonia uniflora]|uniref:Uncharacterized protein n=1 Tax=Kingdonia uniflora TaxID=39325 RepID=A0A7J7NB71_9MAGN|nr:hypothetical protein GIB67_010240 [Kingdonia uniflora]